jgi:hypothetical protein
VGRRPYYQTVWAVLIFAWFSNYLVRMGLSPVLVPVMREFQLTFIQAGLPARAFFYAWPRGGRGARVSPPSSCAVSTRPSVGRGRSGHPAPDI